ncbi:hypothetical protein ABTH92_21365, partial [Acinetobacter baumannii]
MRLEILVLMGRDLAQDLYILKPDETYTIVLQKGERIDLRDDAFEQLARHKRLYVRGEDFADFVKRFAADLQNLA